MIFFRFILLGCFLSCRAPSSPVDASVSLPPALQAVGATTSTTTTPASTPSSQSQPASDPAAFTQEGLATYYADSLHGRKTASGEPYDKNAFTCAHKTLPFGTMLYVESLTNGKTVTVRVNDRGPFSKSRIIDVSRVAAEQLDLINPGKMKVKITVISSP